MIRHAQERPVSTSIAAATLVAIGTFSLFHLPVSFLPDVRRPYLEITLRAEGRSQQEMLYGLTAPLERRLSSIPGISGLRTETSDGLTRAILDTDWQADADRLLMETARRLDNLGEFAPDEQSLTLVDTEAAPILEIAVLGGQSASARDAFTRHVLMPELARLPGAGRIETIGLAHLHAVVRPDAAALAARGITAAELRERLRAVGRPVSAGLVRDGAAVRPMIARESVVSLEQLGEVRVPTPDGPVPLADVTTLSLEEIGDDTSFTWNSSPGVLLRLHRAPGANAVALARDARESVAELGERARSGIRLEIGSDRSGAVVAALSQLGLAALAGILLGTLVLRFMLGTWTPTFALGIVIPASILTSFAAFYFFGLSLNVVSIAGLALAAGMLVDSSIVVLESIESARQRREERPRLAGTREIAAAVVASTFTTVVVFLPLLYLRGLAWAFFGEQAFAIVSSLLAALLFSLTLTPVLAKRARAGGRQRSPGMAALLSLLGRALARPGVTATVGAALIAAGLGALWLLPRDLFPPGEERRMRVHYSIPRQLDREESARRGERIESTIRRAVGEGVVSVLAVRDFRDDSASSAAAETGTRGGIVDIAFDDAGAARRARAALAEELAKLTDLRWRIERRQGAFLELAGSATSRFEIVVTAADRERVDALARSVAESVEQRIGVRPALDRMARPLPVYVLHWDEPRLARLNLRRDTLEDQLRASLRRDRVGRVAIPGVDPELVLEATLPGNPEMLPVGPVRPTSNEAARVVPLRALARLDSAVRPAVLYREEGRPANRLSLEELPGGTRSRDALSLARTLEELPLGPDETVRLAGQGLETQRSFSELRLALILSLVLVFLTLAAVYESLLLPLLIMTTVPTAAGGGLLALALTDQSLNIMSFLGLILLGGIVVNNAIVLVYRIEQLRGPGRSRIDAVRAAVGERYRPILMTTLTTLIGMLPLALLGGEGMELRRALATAVLGGLVTATFASLLLVPALYVLVDRFRGRRSPAAAASGTGR